MSKKICFSSVLKQKRSKHNTLQQMMEEYCNYPQGDYKLRYASNIRGCHSRQEYDQEYNQLDHFINSQKHNNNKQNISDTQPRRKAPIQFLKYVNGAKSPKRLSQVKSDFVGSQQHKNVDMKQICKQYAQNKRNGRDLGKAPVWKFNTKNQDFQEEQQRQIHPKTQYIKQPQHIIRQPAVEEKFRQPRRSEKINQHQQIKKFNHENNLNFSKNNTQSHGKNILKLVQQIKDNLVPQIQVMAERIINQRTKGQDDQLLLSQRESQQQRGQKRMDNVRKQIDQYLQMRNGNGSSLEQQKVKQNSSASLLEKQSQNSIKQTQQKITSSEIQNVGYSFSSDFQSQNLMKPNSSSNIDNSQKKFAQIKQSRTKNQVQVNKSSFNKISLPNIDEVKSERDANQKIQQDFNQSVAVHLKNNQKVDHPQIDKNFIKQIQSVAYTQPEPYTRQNNANSKNLPRAQVENEKIIEVSEKNDKKKSGSLFQQISKTALSIDGNNQEESQQVNISIAEGKQSPAQKKSKESSAKNENYKISSPNVEVNNFIAPANTIKIQFKKIPSPVRTQKIVQNKQEIKEPIKIQTKANLTYTQPYIVPSTKVSTNIEPIKTFTPQQSYKNSFSNILQQNQKFSRVSRVSIQQPSQQSSQIQLPVLHNNQVNYLPQTTFTYNNPAHNVTSIVQTTTAPPPIVHQYHQNSRQRNNSLKNSNQDDQSRKLKITISPKYHGNQHDKHDLVTNVGDFKLGNVKMQQSTQPKHPLTSNTTNSIVNKVDLVTNHNNNGLAHATSSIATKNSLNGNKFRIDNLFTNVTKVGNTITTQTRQVHQQTRENTQQHALIRVQKYQKIQKVVQQAPIKTKQSVSIKNNQSIKSSQQFEFDLDF